MTGDHEDWRQIWTDLPHLSPDPSDSEGVDPLPERPMIDNPRGFWRAIALAVFAVLLAFIGFVFWSLLRGASS